MAKGEKIKNIKKVYWSKCQKQTVGMVRVFTPLGKITKRVLTTNYMKTRKDVKPIEFMEGLITAQYNAASRKKADRASYKAAVTGTPVPTEDTCMRGHERNQDIAPCIRTQPRAEEEEKD